MEKDYGKILTALLAVLFGVFGLLKLVPNIELAVGLLSLTFGLVAIFWTYRAKTSLSVGTSLRDYSNYFLVSLVLIVGYSIWDTLLTLLGWTGYWMYPKYALITVAYLIFVLASSKILYVGKTFGFHSQVQKMDLTPKKYQQSNKQKQR